MPAPAALKTGATYQDLIGVPAHLVAEILDGDLYASPRPSLPDAHATSVLGVDIGSAFHRGRGGPGGWWILDEPELHFDTDIVVPDLAGWRRERLPALPQAPNITLAPDWVCEVISPATEALDRGKKLTIYAREQVPHVWFINPTSETLEVLALTGSRWTLIVTHVGRVVVRAEPFDAIELDLGALWAT